MPFNLSEAMGYGKIVSKLDTDEIVKIPLDKLDASEKNFFRVEDVQDLMESIQLVGLLDPLVVVPVGDRYRILAGHRRKKALEELAKTDKQYAAASCIILPEMSKDMEMVTLIQSNTTARELTSYEKAEAALRLKKHLVELKNQGVKIPGRLRDIVAEQMQISATEVARMEVINKNLSDDWKPFWKESKIAPSIAYEIAKLSSEDQSELFHAVDPQILNMGMIKQFNLIKQCEDWMEKNCPHPLGYSDVEAARNGMSVPCRNLEKILSHRASAWAKDEKDSCPGCCGKCKNATVCKEACYQASSIAKAREAERKRKEEEAQKQQEPKPVQEPIEKSDTSEIAAIEAYNNSPLANISPNLRRMMQERHLSIYQVALRWSEEMADLLGVPRNNPEIDYASEDVTSILEADDLTDIDFYGISDYFALCQAVDTTLDRLLGLAEPSTPAGWHDFSREKPEDGQKVIAMRKSSVGAVYSEYIYKQKRGKDGWYFPSFPDTQANISNVVAWIEPPDDKGGMIICK